MPSKAPTPPQAKPMSSTMTANRSRHTIRLALDYVDFSLQPEDRRKNLSWLGRELRERHLQLHIDHPELVSKSARTPRVQSAKRAIAKKR